MYLLFFGFTGLVGRNITEYFVNKDYFKKIFLFTRKKNLKYPLVGFSFNDSNKIQIISYKDLNDLEETISKLIKSFDNDFLVFNFVGENIFGYINFKKYERIYKSRVVFSRELTKIFNDLKKVPYIYFGASAIGYYSNLVDIEDEIDEEYFIRNKISNDSLMSKLCLEWEESNNLLNNSNVFNFRLGVVLDKAALFVKILRMSSYLGVNFSFGDPFLPWIYSKEIPLIIEFLINYVKNNNLVNFKKSVNVVSPNILRYSEFLRILIKKYRKIPLEIVIKLPKGFIKYFLKIFMGKFYEIPYSLLVSLNIKPKFLLDIGYSFSYNDIEKLEL